MFSRKYGFQHVPHTFAAHSAGIAGELKEDMEHMGHKHHHVRKRIHGIYDQKGLF